MQTVQQDAAINVVHKRKKKVQPGNAEAELYSSKADFPAQFSISLITSLNPHSFDLDSTSPPAFPCKEGPSSIRCTNIEEVIIEI